MKKLIVTVALAFLSAAGYAQQGHASAGVNTGYALDRESVTFGLDFRYNVWRNVRIAPSVTHMFRNNGASAWYIDFDVHYVVSVTRYFAFYPIGGMGMSVWDFKGSDGNRTRLGLNVGIGAELYVTDEISVGTDMKYNLTKDYDQALVAVRVAYHF